jgi:hypothetical protein
VEASTRIQLLYAHRRSTRLGAESVEVVAQDKVAGIPKADVAVAPGRLREVTEREGRQPWAPTYCLDHDPMFVQTCDVCRLVIRRTSRFFVSPIESRRAC